MDMLLEAQERKRAEEKAAREARIAAIMDRMGDVVKKSDDAERAFDKMIIKQAMQKDKEAEASERKQKAMALERNKEIRRTLAQQVAN